MSKLVIEVEENTEIAKKILKNWQFFVYRRAIKALANILYTGIKSYKSEEKGNIKIFIEEGEKEYIELQRKKFENFMFSEEKELTKGKYAKYKKATEDRWLQKVLRNAHKWKGNVKNKAIRSALGGTDIFSFFTKLGIFIRWKVKEDGKL